MISDPSTNGGAGSAKVVHKVVRLQGDEELSRPVQSRLFSGFAAGVAICTSLLAESFLRRRLPEENWAELIVSTRLCRGLRHRHSRQAAAVHGKHGDGGAAAGDPSHAAQPWSPSPFMDGRLLRQHGRHFRPRRLDGR
jgi:hypothetical protein